MPKKPSARLSCRAVPFLEPGQLHAPNDLESDVLNSKSTSPVRAAIERGSDLTFISTLTGELTQQGVDAPHAQSIAYALLCEPSVKVQRAAGSGREVLQAIVLPDPNSSDDHLAVAVEFHVAPGKAGLLKTTAVTIDPVSLEDPRDRLVLIEQVEHWVDEYPLPSKPTPQADLPPWAFLGDIGHYMHDAPPGWADQIRRLGGAHGSTPAVITSFDQFESRSISTSSRLLVGLGHAAWVAKVAEGRGERDLRTVGTRGDSYEQVVADLRESLLEVATANPEMERAPRDLLEGEIVFHRKVGESKKYDKFDDGSPDPCMHGAEKFHRLHAADKAVKGMALRYKNFTPSMLIHCPKYPGCGMYAVDQNRG